MAAYPAPRTPAADPEPALTAADKKYLDDLMKDTLFDPKGAQRVSLPTSFFVQKIPAHSLSDSGAWFVPGRGGVPGRVYCTDGVSLPAPSENELKKLDFVAAARTRFMPAPEKNTNPADQDHFALTQQIQESHLRGAHDLIYAAWLYRLGEEGLAARALASARAREKDPRASLRTKLAEWNYAGMIFSFESRDDARALAHGEHLLSRYPVEAKTGLCRQTAQVVADLKGRQKKGTFGKAAKKEEWPADFDRWDIKKKLAYLLDGLDEIEVRQWMQPGGVDIGSDRRVGELIRMGEPVVPALIDALEADERLTRSVHYWRDFSPLPRTILGTREAIVTALSAILRIRLFEINSTADNFTSHGSAAAKETAERLRAYWKAYGHLPFDERLMKILINPKESFPTRREAAENFSLLKADGSPGSRWYNGRVGPVPGHVPGTAAAKYNNPTAAEAVLALMAADLKAHDAATPKDYPGRHKGERERIETEYLAALMFLGDRRLAPEMAKRASEAGSPRDRRQWATVAHYLGDPKPLQSFADDFRAGKIAVRPGNTRGDDLGHIVAILVEIGTPEADRALTALADPKHPQYKAVVEIILTQQGLGFESRKWFAHPFCLSILRAALDDIAPTGAEFVIEQNTLWHQVPGARGGGPVPEILTDPTRRRDKAAERTCDQAADKLGRAVVGLPKYHPLLKDADERLAALKTTFDRFAGKYRKPTEPERQLFGLDYFATPFLPDICPLGRAATAEDVKTGRALFHLDGKGKPASLKLPAEGVLTRDAKKDRPPRVLIVQAEIGADDRVTYGIISKDGVRSVPATEVTNVKHIPPPDVKPEPKKPADGVNGRKD
ncbi:putative lipoprotein [Fimbriiglobus ruber]|uniref:Putative lipoprotein n=1 Tax=Fimbriiglobus ruber TaxID=1908690 RepID=A0A225DX81_9BACT|nr:putative lipoprotein [Fimbriiglobus ruber]